MQSDAAAALSFRPDQLHFYKSGCSCGFSVYTVASERCNRGAAAASSSDQSFTLQECIPKPKIFACQLEKLSEAL